MMFNQMEKNIENKIDGGILGEARISRPSSLDRVLLSTYITMPNIFMNMS